jgi:raffinose/stachyose/melibiose transport system substrate-binding protein
MSNCEKIKAAGMTAVIGSYKESWTSQIILLSDFYNLNSQAPSFIKDYGEGKAKFSNTPEAVRGFEKTREVYEKGYMNKDFLSTNYDTALKMLAEGSGAHYPMLTSSISNLAANYPDKIDDIGIFAQPSDVESINGLTVWPCGSVYIYKGGKNIDAAKKWASFLASEEGVAAYASKLKPEGPYGVNGIKLPEDISAPIKDELAYFESNSYTFALEFVSPIKGPNLPQICVEAGSGIKSPLECAKEYDKDVEKQAKQLGLYGW